MTENKTYDHTCIQEARLTAIETKLENKKEHLHEVDEDYSHLREKLDTISLNVVELTTILKTMQEERNSADKKIMELKEEVKTVQLEMQELRTNWDNLKLIMGIGVPILTTVMSIVANYLL